MAKNIVREDGTVPVHVIRPGQGAMAYYEQDQLARDAHVFKGAQVFWDHPSTTEERERPERSLRDLCGVAVTDPAYQENGPDGPGIYTDVKVFEHFRPLVNEMAPHIGVSIRASGDAVIKDIGGKKVRVAERFTAGGFDFVTRAGAGGKVILTESARNPIDSYVDQFLAAHPGLDESSESTRALFIEAALGIEQQEELTMAEKEQITQLQQQNAALVAQNKALAEAMMLKEAGEIILAEVAKVTDLPDITKQRLVESLKNEAPTKDGKLDKEALTAKVAEAVKAEKAYVESLRNPGKITGMGGSSTPTGETLKATLKEAYMANGETPEKAEQLAEVAARGY